MFISCVFNFIPFYALNFPLWLIVVLVLAVTFIPFASVVMPVFWIWGLIDSFFHPIDVISIIFYIGFVIYVIMLTSSLLGDGNGR